MKKARCILLSLGVALMGMFAIAAPAFASTNPYSGIQCKGPAGSSPVCNAGTKDPLTGSNGVIVKAAKIVAIFGGFAAVIIIIIAGISLATSGGDSGKVAQARSAIIYASVGLVVIVLAQAIITFIVSKV